MNAMKGKICMVTGATSSIGKVTALELAGKGATVIVVSRNREKCESTVNMKKGKTGNSAMNIKTLKTLIIFLMLYIYAFNFEILNARENDAGIESSITPFAGILENTITIFSGFNLLFHGSAFLSTFAIIQSGADVKVHNYFWKTREKFDAASLPAVYIGYAASVLLGGGLYFSGHLTDNSERLAAGCVVLQSAFLALTYTSLLKAFTGRPNPAMHSYTDENEESRIFRWGFMRNGIHFGWPSGHMAVSTAVLSGLYITIKKAFLAELYSD